MDINVSTSPPSRLRNGCLIIGMASSGKLFSGTLKLEKSTAAHLKKLHRDGDISGNIGSTLVTHGVPGCSTDRILLVGTGVTQAVTEAEFRRLSDATATALHATGTQNALSVLPELSVGATDFTWRCRSFSLSIAARSYRFTEHKSKPADDAPALRNLTLLAADRRAQQMGKQGISEALSINAGSNLARDLGNLAPNVCTPAYLARQAKMLQKTNKKLKVSVLDEAQMKKLGMGALLSVSRGSRQAARLICMDYRGTSARTAPVVLVGKGITFDTGGISIKPSASMDEMKYDMCGAASVIGAMRACLELDLKCNLVCVVAAAENMPDGNASRPGDVVTTMSGQTVEILNTDAEGRLVLCDALTWVKKFNPAVVIDVATLTGASIIALGHVCSAVLGNNAALIGQLVAAGQVSGDRTWELPLWDEYQSQLDSNFADMANIGGRPAGTITAACFLSRFTSTYPWAHLDVAGVASHSGKNKGATGRPVPLLLQYLLDNHV